MRVRLHLLPLAVAAIIVTTAIPIDVTTPLEWGWRFKFDDVVANIVLYAPLGIALWRRPVWMTAALAASMSALIECSQPWSIDRLASPIDVVTNTMGAVCGVLAWRFVRRRELVSAEWPVAGKRAVVALVLITAAIVAVWWLPGGSSAIAGWDRTYPLQLGNERTGDRAWRGSVSSLALFSSALTRRELRDLGDKAADWSTATREAVYVSTAPIVFDGGPAVALPDSVANEFAARATAANAFTIAARIRVASLDQWGPARIVSFSNDPFHRNLDIGQDGPALALRIRTPVTGPNGSAMTVWTSPAVRPHDELMMAATYDGSVAKLYLDGALVGRTNIAALGCAVRAVCGWAEKEVWTGLGGMLAIVVIALAGARSSPAIWVSAAGGAGVVLILLWLHPEPARIASGGWTPALAVVGAIVVALSARRGS